MKNNKKSRKKSRKGQAVMEYLITYGLALFVILIVLGILVAVVLPSLQAPESCQFTQPGFGCASKKHVLVADASEQVRILLQLDNEQGRAVNVSGVLCTTSAPGNVKKSDVDSFGVSVSKTLSPGQSINLGGAGAEVICVDESGGQIVLPAGSNFRGSVAVTYRFTDEVPGAPTRLATATVAGNIQSE